MSLRDNLTKNQKTIITILIVIFTLILIYSVAVLIYRIGKTEVIIKIAPNDAKITLNDTNVSNNSTIWLEPGDYTLKATYNEHLSTYERKITINNERTELYAVLEPLDDEGTKFVNDHQQEYTTIEGLIGNLISKEGEKQKEKFPILKYLPANNSLYSISYKYDKNNNPVIDVKTEPQYIDTVVAKMKTFEGVDLSTQNIVFHNSNPYDKPQQNPIKDAKKSLRAAFQLSDNHIINDIQQIDKYYYTTIYTSDYSKNLDYAHYRVIFTKDQNDEWQIISTPQPILTTYNTPGVSKEILDTINSY